MPFLKKDILKKCLIFNITIIVLTGIGIVAPDAKTHKTLSPDIWYSPLYYCILFLLKWYARCKNLEDMI